MKIVLLSVPGAGKGTTIDLVMKELPNVKEIAFGEVMFEIAKKKYKIESRDEMRKKLSIDQHKQLQIMAAEKISKLKGDIIIDTHGCVKHFGGFYPGLPTSVITKLKPDSIVLLEFNPEDVLKRRNIDVNVKEKMITSAGTVREPRPMRDVEAAEEIEQHQEMNRLFAIVAANEANCYLKIINSRYPEKEEFEHVRKNSSEIIKLIKGD